MSVYEHYDRTAESYDRTRVPVGWELIGGWITSGPLGRENLRLLDAGCGTGAYTGALLPWCGAVEGVDLNETMLGVAARKLARPLAEGRVRLHQGSIEALPLPDASVDAAMVNQVLHHLGDTGGEGFPRVRAVVHELARVLRPGGRLVVNACSREQLQRGWWYGALIPEAVALMCRWHVPHEVLGRHLEEAGLHLAQRVVVSDPPLQGSRYLEGRGPLDPAWRAGDSMWSVVSEERLEEVCAQIRALEARGELSDFVALHDRARPVVGQTTFLMAEKGRD